jgi:hypothetical protein
LFEETIKDIQQKEPLGANIQTLIEANFTKNFSLDIKNQFFRSIGFIRSIDFTDFTGSIGLIGFIESTRFISTISFITISP